MENTNTTKRAAKGGEYGANGEFYEGGKFINTIPENHKRHGSHNRAARVQIEPYTWVPAGASLPIYTVMAGLFGKVINGEMIVMCSDQTLAYYGKTREAVEELAARYNAGERWL